MSIHGPADSEVYAYLAALERGGIGRDAPSGIAMGALGYGAGGPVWLDAFKSKRPPAPMEQVDAYKAVAYACIQLNANGVSRVPLRLYSRTGPRDRRPRRDYRSVPWFEQRRLRQLPYLARTLSPNDEIDEIVEHPFLEALDCPCPYFDGVLFTTFMAVSLDVVGAFYFYPERADPSYAARTWWPLQAQYVFPVKGQGTQVLRSYRYFGDTFEPDELVRIRRVSMRDPYLSNYSPLHACFEQLGLNDYYTAVVESMLKGGARPELAIGPDDPAMPFGDEEAEAFEKDINNRFTGGGSGKVWVMRRPYKVSPISYPPKDLSGLDITKWYRLIAANCFDVPISLLQAEDTNRAVASEGTHQHQYYAIEPRCRLIAAALTHQLARPVNPRLFFAYDAAVQRDVQREATICDMRVKNGTSTINEARAYEGEPPVPWGDEPWLSNSLTQPSIAAEQRERDQANKEAAVEAAAKAAEQGEQPEPDEPPDPQSTKEKDDETRALLAGKVAGLLERLDRSLDRAGDRDGDHGRGDDPPPGDPDRGWGGSARRQHVRPPGWASDQTRADQVVPDPGGTDAGDGSDDRSSDTGDVPAAD